MQLSSLQLFFSNPQSVEHGANRAAFTFTVDSVKTLDRKLLRQKHLQFCIMLNFSSEFWCHIWTVFFGFPFFFSLFLVFFIGSTVSPLNEVELFLGLGWFPPNIFGDLKPPRPPPLSFPDPLTGPFAGLLPGTLPVFPVVLFFCFSFFTDLFTRIVRPSSFEPSSFKANCTESAL